MAQFELVEDEFQKLDKVVPLFLPVPLSNPTLGEAMHSVSAHQLQQYYQT